MTSKVHVVVLKMLDLDTDVPALERALTECDLAAGELVGIVGKTGGTGSSDDPVRAGVEAALRSTLAAHLGLSVERVTAEIPILLSGGAFGPSTPNIALFVRKPAGPVPIGDGPPVKSLVVGGASTPPIAPEQIGRPEHMAMVAAAVDAALLDAGALAAEDVHAVFVKGPAMTPEKVADAHARGVTVITDEWAGDVGMSMAYSNDASALGVAVGLGEVDREEALRDDVIRRRWDLYSDVALTSAAGEKTRADVVVLGNAVDAASEVVVGHGRITSPVDIDGIYDALRSAGLRFAERPDAAQQRDIVHVLMKMVLPSDSIVLGERTTIATAGSPAVIAKAVAATLTAVVTGHTRNYVSGGELDSHQGPPGASPVAAIVALRR